MIKFSLACERGHGFDSWFDSNEAFDTLVRRGLVDCPLCDSRTIEKALMAPAVHGAKRGSDDSDKPVALLNDKQLELRAAVLALKKRIEAETVDVGARFPDMARAIHSGEEPEQAIRGRATVAEARALIEEGIGVMPLPTAPDEAN